MEDYLFAKPDLRAALEAQQRKLKDEVYGLTPDYILNVSETDLCDHLVSEYRVEPPVLQKDAMHLHGPSEVNIDVSQDPWRDIRDRSRPAYIRGTKVTVSIPFEGDPNVFQLRPSTFTTVFPRGKITGTDLILEYPTSEHNPEALRKAIEQDIARVELYLQYATNEIREYNTALPGLVRELVTARKKKLLADAELVAAIGIPIRQREGEKMTYAPPQVRRKATIQRPEVKAGRFAPEPVLQDAEYDYILRIVESMVLVMERSPRAFARMGEESLRDQILVQLNGHYEGGATGETFNYSGKTDILIRAEGKNVFIAECKFWRGPKQLLTAVDQLLSYTSWRDTKTAILIFNRNRDHTGVLRQIGETISRHPCFKKDLGKKGETHFRYLFHQPGDKNREVLLAVLAFDVPSDGREN
jgi:hypothetical protein